MSAPQIARIAVTAIFALNGALFASIFSRLPAIQERTEIGDGALGLALLCAMLGLLGSQLFAGPLIARRGSRPLVIVGGLGYALGLVPIALAGSWGVLAASFLFVGFCQRRARRGDEHARPDRREAARTPDPVDAPCGVLLRRPGRRGPRRHRRRAPAWRSSRTSSPCRRSGSASMLVAGRFLLPPGADAAPEGPLFAVPSRALALVGAFAFCVLLTEGAINDWSAIYIEGELDASESTAAAGLAAFSLTMGIGRLFGDRLNLALGPVRLARGGAALAAAGIGIALLAQDPPLALFGFGCAGIGLAGLFPLALRAAAAKGETAGPSVAAVSAGGYLGFLAGPPMIGGISELAGLRIGLLAARAAVLVAAPLGGGRPCADAVRR